MRKTPWYEGTVRPVRIGWYEIEPKSDVMEPWLEWWNGKYWIEHPLDESQYCFDHYSQTGWRWRGLTKECK